MKDEQIKRLEAKAKALREKNKKNKQKKDNSLLGSGMFGLTGILADKILKGMK